MPLHHDMSRSVEAAKVLQQELPAFTRSSRGESLQRKHFNVVIGDTACGEVGHDFTDDTRELEAVSRKARADRQTRHLGMVIQDKMSVGRHGEHACLDQARWAVCSGKVSTQGATDDFLVDRVGLTTGSIWIEIFVQVMEATELKARCP